MPEVWQTHRRQIILGKDSSGNDIKIRVNDDGYLLAKLVLHDSETTNDEVVATCDAQGRIYVSQAFTGDLTVTMGDVEALLAGQYYKRTRFYEHASGRVKYKCKNTDIDANETDTDWYIWKMSDADSPIIEGPRQGAVNTEAAINGLSWNT